MFIVYTHCVPVAVVRMLKIKGMFLPPIRDTKMLLSFSATCSCFFFYATVVYVEERNYSFEIY